MVVVVWCDGSSGVMMTVVVVWCDGSSGDDDNGNGYRGGDVDYYDNRTAFRWRRWCWEVRSSDCYYWCVVLHLRVFPLCRRPNGPDSVCGAFPAAALRLWRAEHGELRAQHLHPAVPDQRGPTDQWDRDQGSRLHDDRSAISASTLSSAGLWPCSHLVPEHDYRWALMWTHRFFKGLPKNSGTVSVPEYKVEALYSGTKVGVSILGTQCLNTAPLCASAQALALEYQVRTLRLVPVDGHLGRTNWDGDQNALVAGLDKTSPKAKLGFLFLSSPALYKKDKFRNCSWFEKAPDRGRRHLQGTGCLFKHLHWTQALANKEHLQEKKV